jgi:2-oxoglutarate ferredoxin oxidoreductase subunit alpha
VKSITATNDFVVKFANVNGSGSASANEMFAKSILRMGVPVSPRNIFPSNIQGLPTWYEVRVNERGWLGRRGGVDLMVAMNPQTWDADIAEIETGGYLFYDSTRPLPKSKFRDDVRTLGMPITDICNATYDDPRQRQLFKNIIYVGALSVLLGIEAEVIETLIGEQYRSKPKLQAPNIKALHIGRDYAQNNFSAAPIGLSVRRADAVGDRIFVDGNDAAALGCVYGGATVCAWYPITPSSSLAEAFQKYCAKFRVDPDTGAHRYAIVQAEDEIASIGMVTGAGWNGARVHHDVGAGRVADDRVHRPRLLRRNPGHDHRRAARRPVDRHADAHAASRSCFLRLRFARRHQACAAVSGRSARVLRVRRAGARSRRPFADARVRDDRPRHRHEPAPVRAVRVGRRAHVRPRQGHDRRGTRSRQGFRPLQGRRRRRHSVAHVSGHARGQGRVFHARHLARSVRALFRARAGLPLQHGAAAEEVRDGEALVPQPLPRKAAQATRLGVIHFGSTAPAMEEAIDALEQGGIHLDTLRVRAFPFADAVAEFIAAHERVFVVEQNRDAQLRSMLVNEFGIDPARLVPVLHYDGTPITARFIAGAIARHARGTHATPQPAQAANA